MKNILIMLILSLGFAACMPATEITGSWKNTSASASIENYNTILITALTARTNARQIVENDMAVALERKGFRTVISIEVLPPTLREGAKPDKTQLLSKISEIGADAILTIALINKETETRYVPGNYSYAPIPRFGYYGTFWGYYNTWLPTVYSPGYYNEEKVYFIETNLYDATTEQLLWSAQSETYNPSSLADFSSEFSRLFQ